MLVYLFLHLTTNSTPRCATRALLKRLILKNFTHIFQTINPVKLSLVQFKELFKSFPMMYHKCQKTQFKKSTKTLTEKKSIPSTKSHPSINVGWNNYVTKTFNFELKHTTSDFEMRSKLKSLYCSNPKEFWGWDFVLALLFFFLQCFCRFFKLRFLALVIYH